MLLTPGFIGTVVFFHQVHIAGVKGWTLAQMAPGYSAFATATVASSFIAGWAADRFGAHRLLPVLLVPMGLGVAMIGPAENVLMWYVALGVIGMTQGTASALWGVLFPAVYGTRHLGAIRSLGTTIMVFFNCDRAGHNRRSDRCGHRLSHADTGHGPVVPDAGCGLCLGRSTAGPRVKLTVFVAAPHP